MGRFLLGLIIGIALTWFYFKGVPKTTKDLTSPPGQTTGKSTTQNSSQDRTDLRADAIREELSRTGKVIREKAGVVGNELGDAAITALIMGKYAVDPNLSPRQIKVTTENGVVTLAGEAPSPELIQRAIELALDTKGVHRVVSNLQLLSPTSNTTDVPPRRTELPE